ncbi:flagellar hook-associated protein 2 [Alkalibacillus silvisoli]|uniref:Flagellar hook-associated protein 2 n=1 Tax=Alkalibacillus silvisoli TaxID=392823 RepID=A0ABN1ABG0_9BACI
MISNNMRMTGMASGMDINQMVNDLMEAERQPLQKMEQDQRWLELQRDAYREVNTKLREFDDMFLDMRLSATYQANSVQSTNSNAVSATARNDAPEGNYTIEVSDLATRAVNAGAEGVFSDVDDFDPSSSLSEQVGFDSQEVSFSYYNEDGRQDVSFNVDDDDSLDDIFNKISEASDGAVSGFYDNNSGRVFLERLDFGDFTDDGGNQITFEAPDGEDHFFTEIFGITEEGERGGENASFTYNGIEMTSHNNSYEINGVTLNFHNTTGEQPANISVSNDVDGAVDNITEFVEKYNEMIDFMSGKTSEERYRDYPPLTDAQRREMTESEIELWEERSNSGLLRNDSILSSGLTSMRSSWYQSVDNEHGDFNTVMDVGITTTSNWREGGKLEVDEDRLREALQEDSDAVFRLFSNSDEGDSRGIINRVEDSVGQMMDRITDRAGRATHTEHQYTMGRELMSMADRMANFERRMQQTEERYWDQFNRMEQAMQQANNQYAQMQQAMGGMGGMM